MKIRTMNYYMAEAFTSFRRNSFMSIASIATVALALFILGLFSMLAANLDYFADNLENQVELSVYLKDDLTTDQVMAVGRQLKELPDVKDIAFTNKDQAMDKMKERMKDQPGILDALGGKNPLPTSYEITFNNPESVKSAAVSVKDIKGVESTHYGQDIIEQLFKIANVIRSVNRICSPKRNRYYEVCGCYELVYSLAFPLGGPATRVHRRTYCRYSSVSIL